VPESEDQWSCVEQYILGDFLDDAEFRKNVVLNLIREIEHWTTQYAAALVMRIWTTTPSESVLRTLILERTLAKWNREHFVQDAKKEQAPKDFVLQVESLALSRVGTLSTGQWLEKLRAMRQVV
jgi:hypothetical protein